MSTLRNKLHLILCLILSTALPLSAAPKAKPEKGEKSDKPEALLAAAKKSADAQAWSVQAHVNGQKSMKISGIIFGKDFDLTVETIDSVIRQITLGDKNWLSEDGGKTWKPKANADRRYYYLMHTPIKFSADESIPPFEAVGTEKLSGEPLLHIRFSAPDKIQYEGDRPNYWLATGNGQPPVIHRYNGPAGFENNYVDDQVDYAPVSEQNPIVPPPGNPSAAAPPAGPERLLMAALKKMHTGVWEVKGTASYKKTIQLHGLLEEGDFDITMEPGTTPNVPMRQIVIGDNAWICSDGKTWHSGSAQDRQVYNLTHTPILYGRLEPPFQKVGTEQHDGATWLHIQLLVSDAKADPKSLPQYWLALDPKGQPLYVARAEIPVVSRGSTGVTYTKFDYAPSTDKIAPPPDDVIKSETRQAPDAPATPPADARKGDNSSPAPLDAKPHGFGEIETHKFDWENKVVRVEVTPKLLQAIEIGKGTFRCMLKDTTGSTLAYGQVEFPGEALVSLGFLKKAVGGSHSWAELQEMGALGRTEGAPVSFYVRVVPIGQRAAARCIAVGSKHAAEIGYSW